MDHDQILLTGDGPNPVLQKNDDDRRRFLHRLHAAALCPSAVNYQPGVFLLSDWEKHWLEDQVREPRPFSPENRSFTDALRTKFESRLSSVAAAKEDARFL